MFIMSDRFYGEVGGFGDGFCLLGIRIHRGHDGSAHVILGVLFGHLTLGYRPPVPQLSDDHEAIE